MIRLSLLGQISLIAADGKQITRVLAGDRRLSLLAYLAVAMPGARRRDSILAMFWPDAGDEEARHRLRQLLYILRAEFGQDVLVAGGREEIGLNPEHFWCDVIAFEDAHRRGDLETCLRLYGGPFCDGLILSESRTFERWLEDRRERLHDKAVEAAWSLAKRNEGTGDLLDACHWGKQALRLDPDEERLRWLLSLYEQRGDRVRALRLFERFERRLAQEFDLGPSPETLNVIERIRKVPAAASSSARSRT